MPIIIDIKSTKQCYRFQILQICDGQGRREGSTNSNSIGLDINNSESIFSYIAD